MAPNRGGPLAGYRIVDLTMNMSGPLATMVLADQGADVVKVEPPGGEVIRRVGMGRGGTSSYFSNLNRSKRSIVIDLQSEPGHELLLRLVDGADVFVQNFRRGVAERLGLGAEALRAGRPRLIYASVSGFGDDGPFAAAPAYDHGVQALSGIAARQADPRGGDPDLVRHGIVDKSTAYTAAQAITAALLARERRGQGATIEVSMLDVALNFLWPDGMMNHTCLDDDVAVVPAVAGSFRLTKTADGFVSVVTLTDEQWQGMVAASGVAVDERANSVEGRMKHGGETMRAVKKALSEMSTAEVVERMMANEVPCAPVVSLEDLRTHPQIVASGVIEEIDHPALGRIAQPRPAPRVSGIPEAGRWPAPAAGEHTDEILTEAGFSPAEIEELRATSVVA
jgi:crotonobetainyl-CoA:carnitine CoA-transferase CaiB-like acyl-CoA transferase